MSVLIKDGFSNSSSKGVNIKNSDFESEGVKYFIPYKGSVSNYPLNEAYTNPLYISIKSSSVNPLIGNNSGVISKANGDAKGEGVYIDFTIDEGLRSNIIKISFPYKTTNYIDNAIGVYLFDKTLGILIPTSITNLPSSPSTSTFLTTFIPNISSSEYRLYFHVQDNSTSTWQVKLDNIDIENKDIAVGAAISEWRSYTPIVTGAGTLTDVACFWRRVGDTLEVSGRATSGTVDGSTATITLPSGLTQKDYTINRIVGHWWRNINTAGPPKRGAIQGSSGTNIVYLSQDAEGSAVSPFGSSAFNAMIASSQVFSFMFSVRIAQWTSNVNLASDFTEYASNSSVADADDTTSFYNGADGSSAMFNFTANRIRRVRFTRPIQSTDVLTLQFYDSPSGNWLDNGVLALGGGGQVIVSSGTTGAFMYYVSPKLDPREVTVFFYQYRVGTNAWSASMVNLRWRVRKVSNGNMAEVPPVVRAEYIFDTHPSFPYGALTTINYSTKVEDTHSAVTTGTAWKFTAPIDGIYSISLGIISSSIAWPAGAKLELVIKHNEDDNKTRFVCRQEGVAYTGYCFVQGTISIRLKAGESISPQLYTITAMTPLGDKRYANISITRIGS